jgi:hypothetical protein
LPADIFETPTTFPVTSLKPALFLLLFCEFFSFHVMLVGAGTCMRNTDERCFAIYGRTWKLNRDYLKSHHTVVQTGPWLLIKGQFQFK